MLKTSMQDFKHGLTSMGDECNCPMVKLAHSLVPPFLRTRMRIELFKSCGHCWVFQNLMAESKEELKSLLFKVKEESERAGLSLDIKKTKIMAASPIAAWQTVGGKGGSSDKILFLGSKIIADDDCSHEIRRQLLLGRKAMTNIDSVLKSRDITLLTKVHISEAMVFPVVTYGCES